MSNNPRITAPRFTAFIIAVSTALQFSSSAFGAAYSGAAYEGFDYTAGATIDAALTGGTGFNATGDAGLANTAFWGANSTGTGGKTISSGSLDYTAVGYAAETGNRASLNLTTPNSVGVGRNLAQTVDTGSLYFSYLVQKNTASNRTVAFTLFNGTTSLMDVGQFGVNGGATNNGGNFGLVVGSTLVSASTPSVFTQSVTHLVVGRIDFNASGFETISLYLDPLDVTSEGLLTPYLTTSGFEIAQVTGYRIFAGGASTGSFPAVQADFDEIRFGSTFSSVVTAVPEPSEYAIVLSGLLVALIATRRHKARMA